AFATAHDSGNGSRCPQGRRSHYRRWRGSKCADGADLSRMRCGAVPELGGRRDKFVAMECIACGVPPILSANTGHMDLIERNAAYSLKRRTIDADGWGESDIDEIIETLDLAKRVPWHPKTNNPIADLTWASSSATARACGHGDGCTLGPQASSIFARGANQLSLTLRVNTHAAPAGPTDGGRSRSALLAPGPPTMAVLPSADNVTDMPWFALPTAPVPTSFGCSWKVCVVATSRPPPTTPPPPPSPLPHPPPLLP